MSLQYSDYKIEKFKYYLFSSSSMSYLFREYIKAARTLIDFSNSLADKKIHTYPTSEQLKESIRIAAEAFFLSDYRNEFVVKSMEKIITTLYIENKPVSSLESSDVLDIASVFESMIPKKMHATSNE
jgi:hypothetical protein